MLHSGGCHCGNIRLALRLRRAPEENAVRSCACTFCRAHGTRTVSDPDGLAEISAADWAEVAFYRFGSRTADYLVCRRCGVYVGAVCDTPVGLRAVVNTNALTDRAAFSQAASAPDYDGEATEDRLARRGRNWTPAVLRR